MLKGGRIPVQPDLRRVQGRRGGGGDEAAVRQPTGRMRYVIQWMSDMQGGPTGFYTGN